MPNSGSPLYAKQYFLDVLVASGGLFEFKAVERLVRHTTLRALLWINIGRSKMTFTTVTP